VVTNGRRKIYRLAYRSKGGGHGMRRGRFAVLSPNLQRAKVLVGYHVAISTQRIEFERALTQKEISKLGLKPDEVRKYAPKAS
jgi:hypothetical protein